MFGVYTTVDNFETSDGNFLMLIQIQIRIRNIVYFHLYDIFRLFEPQKNRKPFIITYFQKNTPAFRGNK